MGLATAIRAATYADSTAQDVLEAIESPAALLTPELTVAAANRAALAFAGDTDAPGLRLIPGRRWADLCRAADAGDESASELTALSGLGAKDGAATIDYVARRGSRAKAYRLSARLLGGRSGQILVIQTDVTRLDAAENRLAAAELLLADIGELSSSWLWATDRELRFVELSAPRSAFWRQVQPTLIGRSGAEVMTEAAAEIERRRPFRDAVAAIGVDAKIRRIRFDGKPVFDADGAFQGYVGMATDVTAAYEAEIDRDDVERRRERLRASMARAQQLEAVSRLAGGLAHDLNNMLLPIMTLTELVMDELPAGSPARGDLERVIGAAEQARGLVSRLLASSRADRQAHATATAGDNWIDIRLPAGPASD